MRLEWMAIGITMVATFSTFDYPLLFDRMLLGLLLVTAIVSFKWDKNLFTFCLIFIAELAIEETGWFLLNWERFLLFPAYLYVLVTCWITAYSMMGKLTLIVTLCSITAEIYWINIGKVGPEIFWHIFVCANLLMVKHLLLIRPHYLSLKLPSYHDEWRITKIDIDAGYVVILSLIHEFTTIFEYLIRHITNYPMMFVYDSYRFVANVLMAILFYLFLKALAETISSKVLSA